MKKFLSEILMLTLASMLVVPQAFAQTSDSVTVSGTVSDNTALSIASPTCDLGTIPVGSSTTCNYTIVGTTNDTDGATIQADADTAFTDGTDSFDDATGALGDNDYGFYGTTADFTMSGSYGSAYQGVPTIAGDFATSAGPVYQGDITVEHGARAGNSTPAGSYSHIVEYTITVN